MCKQVMNSDFSGHFLIWVVWKDLPHRIIKRKLALFDKLQHRLPAQLHATKAALSERLGS